MSAIELTEEQIAQADRAFARARPTPRSAADELATRIANDHGITVSDMIGPRRFPHLTAARAELYRSLRSQGWSYPAIGRFVGRDHTTIITAIEPTDKAEARKLRKRRAHVALVTKATQ